MKPGLKYTDYRTLRRRLLLSRHILSSAAGVMDDLYPDAIMRRLDSLRRKHDRLTWQLNNAQRRQRRPKRGSRKDD